MLSQLTSWKLAFTTFALSKNRFFSVEGRFVHSTANTFDRSEALISGFSFCNCGLLHLEKIIKLFRGRFGVPVEGWSAHLARLGEAWERMHTVLVKILS